jgi:hypothetical protein
MHLSTTINVMQFKRAFLSIVITKHSRMLLAILVIEPQSHVPTALDTQARPHFVRIGIDHEESASGIMIWDFHEGGPADPHD